MKTFEISKLEIYKSDTKLGQDMYHLNTFNVPKHEGVNKWAGGDVTKKPPENVMKLRESRLSHHLKPIQMMLERK